MHIAGPFVKIQPVRVLEERSRAAELLGPLVHGFYKRSDGIFGLGVKFFAHVFGKRDGGVVARGIIRPRSACSTVSSSPSRSPAVELPTVAAALLTVIFSSILQFSTARIAVMTLVIEAILTCSSALRA